MRASHPGCDKVSEPGAGEVSEPGAGEVSAPGAGAEPGAGGADAGAEAEADARLSSSRTVGENAVATPTTQVAVAKQSSARFWRCGVGSRAIVATAEEAEATARTATAHWGSHGGTHRHLQRDRRGQGDGDNASVSLASTGD